ncbi:MAG TPA: VPDSG-CTERM sorting domain-containing protein [Terrimicrobiaceae bacterium]
MNLIKTLWMSAFVVVAMSCSAIAQDNTGGSGGDEDPGDQGGGTVTVPQTVPDAGTTAALLALSAGALALAHRKTARARQ